ncbi:MAG TPA: alpha/beta hydrolase-fold protein [Kouleothrix sp.]|nr:alpha/beta hydrolase-fold protein [Kouleothrix sp.]
MTETPLSDGTGALIRHAAFASHYVAPRHVDVWLPPGYHEHPERRYPVVYLHDGQNLFDPALSNTAIDWGIDEAIAGLMRDTAMPGAIAVGAWCTQLRWAEYMPARPLRAPEAAALHVGQQPISDEYLRFLTAELKPFVDATYRTLPEQPSTFIMGSSMGGLISLYALTEYPAVFGGAACVSTHWPAGGDLLVDQLAARLPAPGQHRLYFDYGTAGLDAAYEPFQLRMDARLRAAGYTEERDWRTLKFPGADHNEAAWRARARLPLAWLLYALALS